MWWRVWACAAATHVRARKLGSARSVRFWRARTQHSGNQYGAKPLCRSRGSNSETCMDHSRSLARQQRTKSVVYSDFLGALLCFLAKRMFLRNLGSTCKETRATGRGVSAGGRAHILANWPHTAHFTFSRLSHAPPQRHSSRAMSHISPTPASMIVHTRPKNVRTPTSRPPVGLIIRSPFPAPDRQHIPP